MTMLPDLPHGPGFQLISEVVAIESGTNTVHCRLDLDRLRELHLADHFPDKRRFPAVSQIEVARQTLPGLASIFPEARKLYPRIASLRQVRFPGRISPSTATATCVLFSLENANAAAFTLKVGDRLAAEGTMEFVLVDTETPQPPPGFKLVHRQLGFDSGTRTVQAEYDYTGEEVLDLNGLTHLPETLAVEAMVQGAIQIRLGNPLYASKIFWFTGIEIAEFFEPIPREGRLDLLATVETEEKGGRAHCQALYAGKLVARATISFAITRGRAAN